MAQELMYVKEHNIYAKDYLEIYIPLNYFENDSKDNPEAACAVDHGRSVSVFALLYCKGKSGNYKFMNVPTKIEVMQYSFDDENTITIHGKTIKVRTLKFMKDSLICSDTVVQNFNLGEAWVDMLLNGKVPSAINYPKLINIWWNNCEITGIDLQCNSKIMELVITNLYRNAANKKERYGIVYGKKTSPEGYDYDNQNYRNVVKSLSSFSGFIFEDISSMITSGINNSLEKIEEPESPLEKIIRL